MICMENFIKVLAIIAPFVSAILVALLNNWDKFNPSKKKIANIEEMIEQNAKVANETVTQISDLQSQVEDLHGQLAKLSVAQRTGLQTQILEKCRRIQLAIQAGDKDYSEELKQLIILYKEYHSCGYNNQGKLYFNDTIEKASEHNNVLVRDLMNTYFSDYEP